MKPVRIALIGAGSRSFGPATIRDVLLSDTLAERGVDLVLMDINEQHVVQSHEYALNAAERLQRRNARISWTTALEKALDGTDFVISAIEVDRYRYWSQDFHIPRQFGFKQPFGENGCPGGIFHAMRNIPPTIRNRARDGAALPAGLAAELHESGTLADGGRQPADQDPQRRPVPRRVHGHETNR